MQSEKLSDGRDRRRGKALAREARFGITLEMSVSDTYFSTEPRSMEALATDSPVSASSTIRK